MTANLPRALPPVDDIDLVCPLTLDIFTDPVLAEDKHTYERASIEMWFAEKAKNPPLTSPLTRQPMGRKLIPRDGLRLRAEAWRNSHNGAARDKPRLDILSSLDSVTDQIAALNLNYPSIIVVGNENAGKSNLLARLTAIPVLPSDTKLCRQKLATQLKEQQLSLRLRSCSGRSPRRARRPR